MDWQFAFDYWASDWELSFIYFWLNIFLEAILVEDMLAINQENKLIGMKCIHAKATVNVLIVF